MERQRQRINIEDVKVDDMIYIEYTPYSQKYLDEYVPRSGKVVSKEKRYCRNFYSCEEQLYYDLKIMNSDGKIESALDSCDDYFYTIYLILSIK
jgi:hypothetical protein